MNVPVPLESLKPITFSAGVGGCNTSDEVIMAQVSANLRRGLPQVFPHPVNGVTAILACGGPSLKMMKKELIDLQWKGGKVIAVNGTYQWCIDNGIKPSAAVMLDAREFNARFFETPVPGCKYFLASQCHPRAFDVCADRETYIWHACSAGDKEVQLLKEFYFGRANPVTKGTTVGVRTISLFRMLGFTTFEVFGLDSCWLDGEHHSYAQPENTDGRVKVKLAPYRREDKAQEFWCAPWHMKQWHDFLELIRERGDMFRVNVHGPGLIATAMRTGAEIQLETGASASGSVPT